MRAFESYDWSDLPEGHLVLMTVEALGNPKTVMRVADFKDVQALFVTKAGRWVGMSPTRGLRFGTGPLKMVDGIWYCVEDVESQKAFKDFQPTKDSMSLETIG